MYIIETERLGLRRWNDDDIPYFISMNKDPEVMEFFPKLLTADETRSFVERSEQHFNEQGFALWAAELKETGRFIGMIGLAVPRFETDFTPCVEVGWRLGREFWGKGYAQEGGKACLEYGFTQLCLPQIVAFTSVYNTKSENVMQKIGMTFIEEFDHPEIPVGHKLRRHVLYVKERRD